MRNLRVWNIWICHDPNWIIGATFCLEILLGLNDLQCSSLTIFLNQPSLVFHEKCSTLALVLGSLRIQVSGRIQPIALCLKPVLVEDGNHIPVLVVQGQD